MTCLMRHLSDRLQALIGWLSQLNHYTLALATVDLICIVCLLHCKLVWHGSDLFFWCEELNRRLVEYVLSAIVLIATVHVVGSCVDAIIISALVHREMNRHNMPRQHFEERYRRFVFMRLVGRLEQALKVQQTKQSEEGLNMVPLANLSEAQQLIRGAIDEFRTAVRVLLWPNRSDLQAEAFVIYHISEDQLAQLVDQGYSLGDVNVQDMVNARLSHLLNPPCY
ncbi:uncharacterized protein LOC110189983 [Drosophila serrata]|uniref:uncharacterized protein LOC110189983 n=1 Tax=Drosophila serrata TaxID=7274 RepID=UPI000A1D259B|nr:uncharacterized protein LOC110189983 [Drosophila serrata]